MQFNTRKIPKSNNDIRNKICLPTKLSPDLAYFLGIHFGDGHMNIQYRPRKTDYVMSYTGSLENDYQWFQEKLSPLILKLFNKKVIPRIGTKNTVIINFRSKAINHFLHHTCGEPLGPKINADVPKIIKNAKPKIKKAFIRGLADTDFCLTFKARHKKECYYPVIEHGGASKKLWVWLQTRLKEFGFQFHAGQRVCERNGKLHQNYYIQINGKKMLSKWLKEIGFCSYTHLSKLYCWNKIGIVPPNMTIKERQDYLKIKKRPWPESNSPATK